MPATIHDVAKRAGVGIGTVSSVLNNSRPVNEATRQKVLAAIADLDFVPNPSGRGLSIGKTQLIAVVIPFLTRAASVERLRGVMSVIADSDFDISLFTVETIPQRDDILKRVPKRGRADGLLIFSLDPNNEDVGRIQREGIPTVLVEGRHPDLPSLYLDDTAAARSAVQHLIDLGHRDIAYIGDHLDDPFGFPFSANRYRGYQQALSQANLPIRSEYLVQGDPGRVSGRHMARRLLALLNPPSAIFTYSDLHAIGVLEAARDLKLKVPQQLSVVGYDDIELAYFARLTTVRQHLFESGVQGIERLLDMIERDETSSVSTLLPTELIVRQTTAPPTGRQPPAGPDDGSQRSGGRHDLDRTVAAG